MSRGNSRVIMVQPVPDSSTTAVLPVEQNGGGNGDHPKPPSPYEQELHQLDHDPRVSKEILLGKRIRFYQIKGTIGTGNFSKVRLGVHILTKGAEFVFISCSYCDIFRKSCC